MGLPWENISLPVLSAAKMRWPGLSNLKYTPPYQDTNSHLSRVEPEMILRWSSKEFHSI